MTPDIKRRQILLGLTGSLAAVSSPNVLAAALRAASSTPAIPAAPMARIEIVRDTYFGETLADPYRWMENNQDPDWLPYLKGQNARTRAILDALPGRDALLERIGKLSADAPATLSVRRAGELIFFEQRPVGADNFKLFVRDAGGTRTLIDPTLLGGATGHVSLDWWEASPNGKYVVYGLSKDGSEDSILHILLVADGHEMPEQIRDTENASPSWLDDSSGFFYTQLTAPVATPERYLDAQVRFHRLGDDPSSDMVLMKRGMNPEVSYDKIQMPSINHPLGSRYVILQLRDVRSEFRGYTALLSDVLAAKARWRPFSTFEDEVTDFEIDGEDLYLLVNAGTPRGRVVKTKALAPSIANGSTAVAQTAVVIENLNRAHDGLYLLIMDGGISRLQRLSTEGLLSEVRLPFDGAINRLFATPDKDGVDFSFQSWLQPALVLAVAPDGEVTDTGITPKTDIDVSAYQTKRAFATAKDGTKIPYTLIYRKNTSLGSGRAPTWISAYGSYGYSYTPSFASRTLALIDAGAIVGYANVRGGGEYGREWHKAGQLENKPNTWRDLIAVCEELCATKVTSPQHLAIGGRSAGGITVGRAMTERPDLFAAVIDGVGWSNPLRYVVEQDGYGEEPEWGRIDELAGYRALKSIDSYQSIRPGTRYPAVLPYDRGHRPARRAFSRCQDGPQGFRLPPPPASQSCCAWTSTRATASARPAPSKIVKQPILTRSCSGNCAARKAVSRSRNRPMPASHTSSAVALRVEVDDQRSVSALAQGPANAKCCLVLAHGAGAGMHHSFMCAVADGLAERQIATFRFQFPYMEAASKRPDRPPVAHATVRAASRSRHTGLPRAASFCGW